jgi:hypothetical protein
MQISLLGRESCEQLLALGVDAEVEAVGEAKGALLFRFSPKD